MKVLAYPKLSVGVPLVFSAAAIGLLKTPEWVKWSLWLFLAFLLVQIMRRPSVKRGIEFEDGQLVITNGRHTTRINPVDVRGYEISKVFRYLLGLHLKDGEKIEFPMDKLVGEGRLEKLLASAGIERLK